MARIQAELYKITGISSWATDNVLHMRLARKEAGSFTVRSQGLWGTDVDSHLTQVSYVAPEQVPKIL